MASRGLQSDAGNQSVQIRHGGKDPVGKEKDEEKQNQERVPFQKNYDRVSRLGQKRKKNPGAVQRGNGNKIKNPQTQIDEHDGRDNEGGLRKHSFHKQKPQEQSEKYGNKKISQHSGNGHGKRSPLSIGKVGGSIRYGLGPAEQNRRLGQDKEQGQNYGAEHIQMSERI